VEGGAEAGEQREWVERREERKGGGLRGVL
jgi:hypothetical protein